MTQVSMEYYRNCITSHQMLPTSNNNMMDVSLLFKDKLNSFTDNSDMQYTF